MNVPALLASLMSGKLDDTLVQQVIVEVETAVEPFFTNLRAKLLAKVSGAAPPSFVSQAKSMFAFTDEQVEKLWQAAVQTGADLAAGV